MQHAEGQTNAAVFADSMMMEAEAIVRTARRLGAEDVERAVTLLAGCRGKIIVSGVGKSGFVARKVAATLTSTGTQAVFLHPSDALHGDLGIISPADVCVLLSNSGETDEIIAMLPYLKHRGVALVAVTGNAKSTLARAASAVLDAGVEQEVCPFNLAPTSSTTVALAIGDALAVTLMRLKGLTPDDFALNHPAGRLGKRLSLRVADLMHGGADAPAVAPAASWLEVVTSISRGGLGAVNVVDEEGRLAGLITDGDLRRAIERTEGPELERLRAEAFMTRGPVTVAPHDLAYYALQLMENRPRQISVLPVADEGRCVGLLRLHDIVRSGLC